jgi:hypothetical protein
MAIHPLVHMLSSFAHGMDIDHPVVGWVGDAHRDSVAAQRRRHQQLTPVSSLTHHPYLQIGLLLNATKGIPAPPIGGVGSVFEEGDVVEVLGDFELGKTHAHNGGEECAESSHGHGHGHSHGRGDAAPATKIPITILTGFLGAGTVRVFFDGNLLSRMPLVPTLARFNLLP